MKPMTPAFVGDRSDYNAVTIRMVERLAEAATGLRYVSENDSDVQPIAFHVGADTAARGAAAFTVEDIANALAPIHDRRPAPWQEWDTPLGERLLETTQTGWFLEGLIEPPHYRSDDGVREGRWATIRGILDEASDHALPTLKRLGSEEDGENAVMGTVDVFLIRQTGAHEFAGIWMVSIET
jgi:hypothetical protein